MTWDLRHVLLLQGSNTEVGSLNQNRCTETCLHFQFCLDIRSTELQVSGNKKYTKIENFQQGGTTRHCRNTSWKPINQSIFLGTWTLGPQDHQTWNPATYLLGLGQNVLWMRVMGRCIATIYWHSFVSRNFRDGEVYMGWVSYQLDKVYSTTVQYVKSDRLQLYKLTFRPTFLSFLSMCIILEKV